MFFNVLLTSSKLVVLDFFKSYNWSLKSYNSVIPILKNRTCIRYLNQTKHKP